MLGRMGSSGRGAREGLVMPLALSQHTGEGRSWWAGLCWEGSTPPAQVMQQLCFPAKLSLSDV